MKREPVFRPEPTQNVRESDRSLVLSVAFVDDEDLDELIRLIGSDDVHADEWEACRENVRIFLRRPIGQVARSLWMARIAAQPDRLVKIGELLDGIDDALSVAFPWTQQPFRIDPDGLVDSDLVRDFARAGSALRKEIRSKLPILEAEELLDGRVEEILRRFVWDCRESFGILGGDKGQPAATHFTIVAGRIFGVELTERTVENLLWRGEPYGRSAN